MRIPLLVVFVLVVAGSTAQAQPSSFWHAQSWKCMEDQKGTRAEKAKLLTTLTNLIGAEGAHAMICLESEEKLERAKKELGRKMLELGSGNA